MGGRSMLSRALGRGVCRAVQPSRQRFLSGGPPKPPKKYGGNWTREDKNLSKAAKAHYDKDGEMWRAMTPDMNWGITHPMTIGLAATIAVVAYHNQGLKEERDEMEAIEQQHEERQLARIKAKKEAAAAAAAQRNGSSQ